MITQHEETLTGSALDDLAQSFGATGAADPGRAGDLASGLAQQSDLAHQVADEISKRNKRIEDCGKHFYHIGTDKGKSITQPILCGVCEDCVGRRGDKIEKRILMRIETRKDDNDNLIVSQLLNVPTAEVMALQKRIQRDETAQYYRAINEAGGFDFIIQSETVHGDVVETVDYDFALAAKVAKAKGKYTTGSLSARKTKKTATETDENYSISLTKIITNNPDESKRASIILKSIKPTEIAYDAETHQKSIFAWTNARIKALEAAGIAYHTSGLIKSSNERRRGAYNSEIEAKCPDLMVYKEQNTIPSNLDKQSSLLEPEPETEPAFYQFETSEQEDIERQITLCWMN